MRARLSVAGLLLGLALLPLPAGASGDGACGAHWTLDAQPYDCASRIVIGPGNDTRVNLLLLLRDRAGLDDRNLTYFDNDWVTFNGHNFFDWKQLVASYYPSNNYPSEVPGTYDEPSEFSGTRCQSVKSGGEEFLAAVVRNRRIGARDRVALGEGREQLVRLCQATSAYVPYFEREAHERAKEATVASAARDLPHTFASAEAREFGSYLAGAAAFYRGNWRAARASFAGLRRARDEWVRETALYMTARNELGAAAAVGVDEWGYFDSDLGDKVLAARAEEALRAYLAVYPGGRYAASATGLVRRALWLGGAEEQQGQTYGRMLAEVDAGTPAAVPLIEEIDDKFLAHDNTAQSPDDALLLAARDLERMRSVPEDAVEYYSEHMPPPLTAIELASQQAVFAGHPELYDFLKASFAFYVERDYPAVLRLVPDDARKRSYTPLQFSRQVLRGMALAELKDRNEAGFWQQLLDGSKGLYQRPAVELGLALSWERRGEVAQAFAPGSPVEDERIRSLLLAHAAGPEVLRGVAAARDRPQRERDLAAFVLLYKELNRASYAAAARDLALARADGATEPWFYWDVSEVAEIPVGLFVSGQFSDNYACPALRETVASLARNSRDVKGRLCLGEFYRLNGFDNLRIDDAQAEGELGSFAAYPGKPIPRSRLYDDIMAERGVGRNDRAYALYRAIRCYAPGGNSSCGGEEVPQAQRRAWFRRLKGEFGDTRWGREAVYYW